jgi:hypothetical protein
LFDTPDTLGAIVSTPNAEIFLFPSHSVADADKPGPLAQFSVKSFVNSKNLNPLY